MDSYDLFRKLKMGTKFDFKRFRDDAVKFKVIKSDTVSLPCKREIRTKRFRIKSATTESNDTPATVTVKESLKPTDAARVDCGKKRVRQGDDDDDDDSSGYSEGSSDDENNRERDGSGANSDEEVEQNQVAKRSNDAPKTENQKKKLRRKKKVKTELDLKRINKEKVSHYRKLHRIYVTGSDVAEPIESFSQLVADYGVSETLLANIMSSGYTAPTPIQMQAIPILMHKREVLACAPTGSGKTDAFLIPVLHHLQRPSRKGIRVVVVEPTRELARQVFREACRLNEGLGFGIQIIEKVGQLKSKMAGKTCKIDILITTPNRLIYALKMEPPVMNLDSVEWLIVDESDKLFEAGNQGFREQLSVIFNACTSSKLRRALFSATFVGEVQQWCKVYLDNLVTVSVGIRNAAAETVEQELVFVGSEEGKLVAVRDLVLRGITPPVLVFVQSKERARDLFNELIYDGINVDVIHSDRTQQQRDNVVRSFRAGHIWVLICTELMGRGIDFIGVNLVINFDFPPNAISYIHRIGRTGRAGHPGKALTFYTEQDFENLKCIAHIIHNAGCPVPEFMLKVPKNTHKNKHQTVLPRDTISTTPAVVAKRQKELDKHPSRRIHPKRPKTKTAGSQKPSTKTNKPQKELEISKVSSKKGNQKRPKTKIAGSKKPSSKTKKPTKLVTAQVSAES